MCPQCGEPLSGISATVYRIGRDPGSSRSHSSAAARPAIAAAASSLRFGPTPHFDAGIRVRVDCPELLSDGFQLETARIELEGIRGDEHRSRCDDSLDPIADALNGTHVRCVTRALDHVPWHSQQATQKKDDSRDRGVTT
jgi:hypothetical protein